MTIPCTKGAEIERIEKKIDRLTELVTAVAVQDEKIKALSAKCGAVEKRLDAVEATPRKVWIAALIAIAAAGINFIVTHITKA